MASVKKFTHSAVFNQIRHIERTVKNPSNPDIDKTRLKEDYFLSPDRGMTNWDYYQKRKSELYCYGREDVRTLAGWIVTCPKDTPEEQQYLFMQNVYNFLADRYGEENIISCVCHNDESGQPHLHFLFIPTVYDKKKKREKICAKSVLNQKELRNFHPDLQRYLHDRGISGTVMSGVTRRQGGNRTVQELKAEREQKREVSRWVSQEKNTEQTIENRWR